MNQVISKHSITINVVSAIIVIGSIITFTLKADYYLKQIDENKTDITTMKASIKMIPLMNQNINDIKKVIDDNFEIKPKTK